MMTTHDAQAGGAGPDAVDEFGRLLLETSAERVELLDTDGRIVSINAIGRRVLAAEQPEVAHGCRWELLWSEPCRPAIRAALERARAGALVSCEAESAAPSAQHQRRWHVDLSPLRDEYGRPVRLLAISRPAEGTRASAVETCAVPHAQGLEQLRLSEERLRLALTGAALGTWHWDLRSGELRWSELSFAMFGLEPRPALRYEEFRERLHPSERDRVEAALARAIREHTDYEDEFRVLWPDQSVHWVATRGRAFYDAQGTPLTVEGVAQDITMRKRAERALHEGEERFRQLADAIPHLVWQLAADGTMLYANRRWIEYNQRTSIEPSEWSSVIHPEDHPRAKLVWGAIRRGESNLDAFRLRRHDGRYLWFACRVVPVFDADGRLSHTVGTATEIEHLKQTEAALRESRARLDTALRAAGMGTWVWHMDTGTLQFDALLSQLIGFSEQGPATVTLEESLEHVHSDDRPAVRAATERALAQLTDFEVEFRLARTDRQVWLAAKGRVQAGAPGSPPQMLGASVDVTPHKRLEEELRQAQKMEAIGQLAGGVAHDFNNLLMVILGQVSLISAYPGLPDPVKSATREIAAASERAASLTVQLLAFGRRQTLQMKELDLNEVVVSVGQMLQRLLGENVSLSIETDGHPLRLCADSNALVQVLLNLALNARDAMSEGGRLTIRTSVEVLDERSAAALPEARAGSWVCLTVSDTGTGIPAEILPRIFEPFFTTKPVGKGTGLGLATVYGVVKQHHGFVVVDSTPQLGTTFRAYLPLPAPRHEAVSSAPPALAQAMSGHKELVLLVEDDPAVRATISSILEQHNYRLVAADDGVQALELFAARGPEIDLLLSDVVLPRGLSGADLALQLRAQNPRLRVILCSGYSADKIEQVMTSLPGMTFLQKPYRPEQLLTLLRSLLDKGRGAQRAASLPP